MKKLYNEIGGEELTDAEANEALDKLLTITRLALNFFKKIKGYKLINRNNLNNL